MQQARFIPVFEEWRLFFHGIAWIARENPGFVRIAGMKFRVFQAESVIKMARFAFLWLRRSGQGRGRARRSPARDGARSSPAGFVMVPRPSRPLRKSADAEKIWAGAHFMNHPVPRPSQRTLLSIIELGGYPDFKPLYRQAGYDVESVASVRKALGLLKKINPDVIVAEFNFQSDFRDRSSSLESLLAVLQRMPKTKVIVFYEKEHAHQLTRITGRFPIHETLPFPIDPAKLEQSLQRAASA
jgi:hypothetical protein